MWTPAWFDAIFMALMHPITWVAIGIVIGLLLGSAWHAIHKSGTDG